MAQAIADYATANHYLSTLPPKERAKIKRKRAGAEFVGGNRIDAIAHLHEAIDVTRSKVARINWWILLAKWYEQTGNLAKAEAALAQSGRALGQLRSANGRKARKARFKHGAKIEFLLTHDRVTVGSDQSVVEGGQVARKQALCAGGSVALSAELAQNSAVMVFRGGTNTGKKSQDAGQPTITVFGTRPVFVTAPSHRFLTIERLDAAEPAPQRFDLDRGRLDLAQTGAELAPGGVYRAENGSTEIVFKIDALAGAEGVGLMARLVRM